MKLHNKKSKSTSGRTISAKKHIQSFQQATQVKPPDGAFTPQTILNPSPERDNASLALLHNPRPLVKLLESANRVNPALILHLQRTIGNRAVANMLDKGVSSRRRNHQQSVKVADYHATDRQASTNSGIHEMDETQPQQSLSVTPADDSRIQPMFAREENYSQIIPDPEYILLYLLAGPWAGKTKFGGTSRRPLYTRDYVIRDFHQVANSKELVKVHDWLRKYDRTLNGDKVLEEAYKYSQKPHEYIPFEQAAATNTVELEEGTVHSSDDDEEKLNSDDIETLKMLPEDDYIYLLVTLGVLKEEEELLEEIQDLSEDKGESEKEEEPWEEIQDFGDEGESEKEEELSKWLLKEEQRERRIAWDTSQKYRKELLKILHQKKPRKRKVDEIINWFESDQSDFESGEKQPKKAKYTSEGSNDEFRIVVITWNMEKLGEKSDTREIKAAKIVEIVQNYHPTVMVMQEVTNAGVLLDGVFWGKRRVPLGGGILNANLIRDATDMLLAQQRERLKTEPKWSGVPAPNYPLSTEYGTHKGPAYRAGTYKESQPILYDKVAVKGEPKPFFVKEDDGKFQLVEVNSEDEETFSSEQEITRSVLVWRVTLQTGAHAIRPKIPRPKNASQFNIYPNPKTNKKMEFMDYTIQHRTEAMKTQDIYILVVHTSPSINIKNEVAEIMEKAQWLREGRNGEDDPPIPIILAGDWYMQKEDPERFKEYVETSFGGEENAEGEKKSWRLEAPQVRENDEVMEEGERPTYSVSSSKEVQYLRTNYPRGIGQTADHFIVTEQFRTHGTEIIAKDTSKTSFLTTSASNRKISEEEDAKTWTEIGADHTPVVIYLTVEPKYK